MSTIHFIKDFLMKAKDTTMHPELIKAEMRMRGVTPSALADQIGVSHTAINSVINGRMKSERVREAVAKAINKPIGSIWPQQTSGLRRIKVKAVAHA